MNKKTLAKKIETKFFDTKEKISKKAAESIIDSIFGTVLDELEERGSSTIIGFGTFKVKEVKPRQFIMRSPISKNLLGKTVQCGGYKKVVFKSSKKINKGL